MSQQMSHEGSYRPEAEIPYGYEGRPYYNNYSATTSGQKLSSQIPLQVPSASQRLILAIASLISMMIVTFGVLLLAIAAHADVTAGIFLFLLLALFYSATVIINVVFNRRR